MPCAQGVEERNNELYNLFCAGLPLDSNIFERVEQCDTASQPNEIYDNNDVYDLLRAGLPLDSDIFDCVEQCNTASQPTEIYG